MIIRNNTLVSGQFSVYVPTESGELKLVSKSKNLVVKSGLNAVGTTTWANCLKRCLAGSGTTPPTTNDTDLQIPELVSTAVSPEAPACYTLAEPYDSVNGVTYRIGKTWKLDNTTGSSKTIRELGVTTTATGPVNLFSRSIITPFILDNNKFAFVVYELRITTGASTTRQPFQVTTDGTQGFLLPDNSNLGVIVCPFAYLQSSGTLVNTTQCLFEPSTPSLWLHYLKVVPGTFFNDKRTSYEANQSGMLGVSNNAGADLAYSGAHSNGYKFSVDDGGTYITDSFKRTRHIIVSPEVPSLVENIYGFAIAPTAITGTGISQIGLHCTFPSAWSRPVNAFTKIYFEQTWAAV